jgi:hypothetical protein
LSYELLSYSLFSIAYGPIFFAFTILLLLKYLMIPRIKERLAAYKPQDIHCVRSVWAGVVIPIYEVDNDLYIRR